MQCKYGTVWLTGEPWQEDCGTVDLSVQQLTDQAGLWRSRVPFLAGRDNRMVVLEFPVVIEKGGWMPALQYCHQIGWLLPADGELVFIEQFGADKVTITYAKAAFQKVVPRRTETTVEVVYSFLVAAEPTFVAETGVPLRLATEGGSSISTEE